MQDPHRKQCTHGVIQDSAISTVELSKGCQTECEGDVFEEVGMRAGVDGQVCILSGIGVEVFVFCDTVVDDAVGEVD